MATDRLDLRIQFTAKPSQYMQSRLLAQVSFRGLEQMRVSGAGRELVT